MPADIKDLVAWRLISARYLNVVRGRQKPHHTSDLHILLHHTRHGLELPSPEGRPLRPGEEGALHHCGRMGGPLSQPNTYWLADELFRGQRRARVDATALAGRARHHHG
jgi:hypothetical protein